MDLSSISNNPIRDYSGSTNASETKNSLTTGDFYKLLAAQLSHQDVLNPTEGTDFIAQMAQLTSLQAAENSFAVAQSQLDALTTLLQATYAQYGSSLVGKEVLVATVDDNGMYQEVTGVVDRMSLGVSGYSIWINGKAYGLSSVMEIRNSTAQTDRVNEVRQDRVQEDPETEIPQDNVLEEEELL